MVRIGPDHDPLLRRPFSIHDRFGRTVRLLFKIVGRGTARLADKRPGQKVDLLGPLGQGFPEVEGSTLLIGGGLGVAPLLFLAKERRREDQLRLRLGAARQRELWSLHEFRSLEIEARFFTEDGSLGHKGLVTAGLAAELKKKPAIVYACGPEGMLKEVALAAAQAGVKCYFSLERRMACGLGACLGCAVEARGGGVRRVCQEGPVFEAGEVIL